MLVHIGGGIRAADKEFIDFKIIIDTLHGIGSAIARNWIEASNYATQKGVTDEEIDWEYAAHENERAIQMADLYIAEVTAYRLYHGYELALALQKGIPALLVSRT